MKFVAMLICMILCLHVSSYAVGQFVFNNCSTDDEMEDEDEDEGNDTPLNAISLNAISLNTAPPNEHEPQPSLPTPAFDYTFQHESLNGWQQSHTSFTSLFFNALSSCLFYIDVQTFRTYHPKAYLYMSAIPPAWPALCALAVGQIIGDAARPALQRRTTTNSAPPIENPILLSQWNLQCQLQRSLRQSEVVLLWFSILFSGGMQALTENQALYARWTTLRTLSTQDFLSSLYTHIDHLFHALGFATAIEELPISSQQSWSTVIQPFSNNQAASGIHSEVIAVLTVIAFAELDQTDHVIAVYQSSSQTQILILPQYQMIEPSTNVAEFVAQQIHNHIGDHRLIREHIRLYRVYLARQ